MRSQSSSSRATLRLHYPDELATGGTKANSKVAESLYRKAIGDGHQSVAAAIFWLKTRAHWKEVSATEISGPDGRPLVPELIIRFVDPETGYRELGPRGRSLP